MPTKAMYYKFFLSIACLMNLMGSDVAAKNNANIPELKKIVVSGQVPGPELWKVSKGDNSLWILGTLSPLPKRIDWNSKPVEQVIQTSQGMIITPSFSFDLDEIGFFKKISLATAAIGIRNNPEKQKLKNILPSDLYSRWLILKKKYLGNGKKIEKSRPVFAGYKLFDKALKKNGLTRNTKIVKKLVKVAKKHKVPVIEPKIEIEFEEPKSMIKSFKQSSLNDHECLAKTLERIEIDLTNMSTRANAWSFGDIATIESLPAVDSSEACIATWLNSDLAEQLEMTDIRSRLKKQWLAAVDDALESNQSTFAVWPITQLLSEESILQDLATAGYEIEAPE